MDASVEIDKAAIEQQLRVVDAAYKVPDQLFYKRAAEVAFILEVEGAGTAKSLSGMPGKQADVKVDVARFVRAELSGAPDMVKITLRGGPDSLRQFTGFRNVGWTWDVEGLQVGQVDLTLKLFAEVTIDGKPQPVEIKTFQKKIPIAISVWESVKQWTSEISAMWPFLTAAASALAAVFAFFGFKPKTAAAKPGNS